MLRLQEIRGWSLTAISNIVLAFYLAAVVFSFWISKQPARRGPRSVVTFGAIASGGALIALPRVENLGLLLAVFLVLSLGWSATNTNPISTTVLAWFPNRQRQLSIALVGASLGGIILIPLLGDLDNRFGFATATTTLGILTIIAVVAVGQTLIDRPTKPEIARLVSGLQADIDSEQQADRMAWAITRSADYWVLAGGLAFSIAAQGGFLVHQISILTTTVSAPAAARIVGVATDAAFVGRFGPVGVGNLGWRYELVTGHSHVRGLIRVSVLSMTSVATAILAMFHFVFAAYILGNTALADQRFLGGFDAYAYADEVARPVASVIAALVIGGLGLGLVTASLARPVSPIIANVATATIAGVAVLFSWLGAWPVALVAVFGSVIDLAIRTPDPTPKR